MNVEVQATTPNPRAGAVVSGLLRPGYEQVLTPDALAFVAELTRRFAPRIEELLQLRTVLQSRFDAGLLPEFRPDTASIREGDWTCAELPADILDRRVEITGPIDRKMIINALNSGANVFMADCEDSSAPTWDNMVQGQINLRDAVRRTIRYVHPTNGKIYELGADPAVLFVRPRGLHLWERHVTVDGKTVPGSLFDFGLYFFHNAAELIARGTGPYFYLPKLQSRLEARLWNDVFVFAQSTLGVPLGTIKATVLIETLPAAFEMEEILYELRDHSAGLNCGRWDYIFSFIKTFRQHADFVLPDRGLVGMTQPFMAAYTARVVHVCHKRGVHAMGGMAAQIPIKSDPDANEVAINKVRADKLREVQQGHDGTWVAHPGLVAVAKDIFDEHMPTPNQIDRQTELQQSAEDLMAVPTGTITEQGVYTNVNIGLQYLEAWLRGNGCVPLYFLMEDAATAEISRAQLWQWIRHGAKTESGRVVTQEWVLETLDSVVAELKAQRGDEAWADSRFEDAAELLAKLLDPTFFHEFLTLPAYELLAD